MCEDGIEGPNASYPTLAAVVNFAYARRHGYRFTRFTLAWEAESLSRHGLAPPARNLSAAGAACVHVGSRVFRHAAWGKILAAWLAASTEAPPSGGAPPAWIMYLDSDAVFQSQNITIFERMAAHAALPPIAAPINASAVVFFDNHPWSKRAPNTGAFLFRPGAAATGLFEHWWTAPDGGKAMKRLWEQQSLWDWGGRPPWQEHIAVVHEPAMGPKDVPGQWVRHWAGRVQPTLRAARIQALLKELNMSGAQVLSAAREIAALHTVRLDVVDVAARVEESLAARV